MEPIDREIRKIDAAVDGEIDADISSVIDDASSLVRLLAQPARLRVFAAVVLGATTSERIAAATGLDNRDVLMALRKLADGGVLEWTGGQATADDGVFVRLARRDAQARAAAEPGEDLGYADGHVTTVLRAFVRNGRLLGLPAARRRRIIVLEHVTQSFEPGVDYPESDVDAILKTWSANSGVDHISLRRYLIDEDLLRREDGIYRRSGGWTDMSVQSRPQRTTD